MLPLPSDHKAAMSKDWWWALTNGPTSEAVTSPAATPELQPMMLPVTLAWRSACACSGTRDRTATFAEGGSGGEGIAPADKQTRLLFDQMVGKQAHVVEEGAVADGTTPQGAGREPRRQDDAIPQPDHAAEAAKEDV